MFLFKKNITTRTFSIYEIHLQSLISKNINLSSLLIIKIFLKILLEKNFLNVNSKYVTKFE